jgi:hypothetical protein
VNISIPVKYRLAKTSSYKPYILDSGSSATKAMLKILLRLFSSFKNLFYLKTNSSISLEKRGLPSSKSVVKPQCLSENNSKNNLRPKQIAQDQKDLSSNSNYKGTSHSVLLCGKSQE